MCKPELWQNHNEYRTLVPIIGRRLSRNSPKYSFSDYDRECQKLLTLNLDLLLEYIPGFYSEGGRPQGTGIPARHCSLQAKTEKNLKKSSVPMANSKSRNTPVPLMPGNIVDKIMAGNPASDNPEAALQKIFSILAVLPSAWFGLIDTADLNYVRGRHRCGLPCFPFWQASFFLQPFLSLSQRLPPPLFLP